MTPFILEICCFNLQSVITAVGAGADRIELCMDAAEGGTTPSYGLVRAARAATPNVRLYPIIRPRGGDFFYDKDDYAQMRTDIAVCRDLGCDGVVIGGLTQDGEIDSEHCASLVAAAGPLGVTFHRAFDRVKDPLKALEDVIALRCERILTSGCRPTAVEGAPLIKQLIQKAAGRIAIMPGAGVRAENVIELQAATGAKEFHTSARVAMPSLMQYVNPAMQEHLTLTAVHTDEVRQLRALLDNLYNS